MDSSEPAPPVVQLAAVVDAGHYVSVQLPPNFPQPPQRPSASALVGQVVDGYRIMALIGEGGMGAVYRAEQDDGPVVAIKVLHEELGDQPDLRERFEREARALFGLEHPNILHVVDIGIVGGMPYLAMELLEGQPLDQLVEDAVLSPPQAFDIAGQVLTGLAYAHGNGALHRDLKTENVFVSRDSHGRPVARLLDFGPVKFVDDGRWGASKKLTVQGSVFGTPAYMAPEQCAGAPVDARGDVYSAGVILFELFTGMWPFMEESRVEMFQAHFMAVPPTMSDVSELFQFRNELEALVQKALAKKAADRFQNAGEMLAAFGAVAQPVAVRKDGATMEPLPPNPPQSIGEMAHSDTPNRNVGLLIGLGVAFIVLVLVAFVLVFA